MKVVFKVVNYIWGSFSQYLSLCVYFYKTEKSRIKDLADEIRQDLAAIWLDIDSKSDVKGKYEVQDIIPSLRALDGCSHF